MKTIRIDAITESPMKNGKPFWKVRSGEEFINCFDRDVAEALLNALGKEVVVETGVSKDGKYMHIKEIVSEAAAKAVEKHGVKSPQVSSVSGVPVENNYSNEKDKLIVRQSCLKAAVELISSITGNASLQVDMDKNVDLIKLVLMNAEEFEKWVWR